jgi:addiction module RelE/StbE family toxin
VKRRKVIWTEKASDALKQIYHYIHQDSPIAAKKVVSVIIHSSKALSKFAEQHQLDEFYPNNLGDIRRYYCWSYRIIYKVEDASVFILNILHCSREPSKTKS